MEDMKATTGVQDSFLDNTPQDLPTTLEHVVEETNKKAVDRFGDYQQVADSLRTLAIKKTRLSDWVRFGPNAFLQSCGAERLITTGMIKAKISRVWIENIDEGEIPYVYLVRGDIALYLPGNPVPIEVSGIEGGRGCDAFFQKGASAQHRAVNPLDVRGAAISAWTRRAISTVLGLRGIPWEEIERVLGKGGQTPGSKATTVPIRQGAPSGPGPEIGDGESSGGLGKDQLDVGRKLKEILGDDYKTYGKYALKAITHNAEKGWEGKTSLHDLTEKGARWVMYKLSSTPPDFVRAMAEEAMKGEEEG